MQVNVATDVLMLAPKMNQMIGHYTKVLIFLLATPLSVSGQAEQDRLIEAEKVFAAYCGENGVPAAWIKFFAGEGVVFTPHPKSVAEVYGNGPVATGRPQNVLYWEPYHGSMASSADLGFNTGPWKSSGGENPSAADAYGYFFSVWKKQASGEWKVLLDLGTSVPKPGAEHVFGAAYDERGFKNTMGKSKAVTLEEAEYLFNGLATRGMKGAYTKMAAVDILSTVSGFHPFYNKRSLLAWLSSDQSPYLKATIFCSTTLTETAASGDFGYSYGSYEINDILKEKGYYVRIWRKTTDGVWYLFAEVLEDNVKRRSFK